MGWLIIVLLLHGSLSGEVVHPAGGDDKGPGFQERCQRLLIREEQRVHGFDRSGFLLDTTKYATPLVYDQTHGDAAFDGTNYVTVWQDWETYSHNNLRITRLDQQGGVLDYGGIWLSDLYFTGGGMVATVPAICFGDSVYLIVFEDIRAPYWDFDLFGIRIKPDGTVLDPDGFAIVSKYYNQGSPRVSFDGTNFLIAYQEYNYDTEHSDVWGVRVGQDGTVYEPNGFPIRVSMYNSGQPDIAYDGTNYLAIWKDYRMGDFSYVYGTRIGIDGTVIDSNGFPISAWETAWGWPRITFGGGNYFVAWGDTSFDIVGTRVTPAAQVLDVPPIGISPSSLLYTCEPILTFDGIYYLTFWIDSYVTELYLTRVSMAGMVLDPTPVAVADIPESVSWIYSNAASGIDNSLVVWTDKTVSSNDIHGARVDTAGTVIDPGEFPITVSNNYQEFSAVRYNGGHYLSTWAEFRDGLWDIYGIRIDTLGNRIEANAFPIARRNWTQYWNRIAYLDTINLVVWHAKPATWDVHGSRVSRSGAVLDPSGIAIGAWQGDQAYPSVAAGDSSFFVVWDDSRNGDEDIYGAIITKAGQNINPMGLPISTASYAQWYPGVAFDGTNYCVVWEDFRSMNANWGYVYGSRVDQSGTVLDEIVINDHVSTMPRIAFGDNQFLVVWMDARTYSNYDIYGSRVKPDGAVLDPGGFPICSNSADQAYPDVIFDGVRYVVTWEDYRNGNADIFGAVVDTNGIIDSTFIITQEDNVQCYAAITKGPSDQIFHNYTGWSDGYHARRIFGQLSPEVGVKEIAVKNPGPASMSVFPNPFVDRVEIQLAGISKHQSNKPSEMSIYDVSGRMVKRIPLGTGNSNLATEVIWDGRDMNGKRLSPGTYFLKSKIGNREHVHKLIKMSK